MASAVSRAAPRSDSARRALSKSNTWWKGAGKMLFKCPEEQTRGLISMHAHMIKCQHKTRAVAHTGCFFRRFPEPHSAKLDSRRLFGLI